MNLHRDNNKEVLFDPFFISFNLEISRTQLGGKGGIRKAIKNFEIKVYA